MLLPSKNFNICTITEKYELQHLYHHHAHHAQGNRLGFYEKLGEYEARPAYRWRTDEDLILNAKMVVIEDASYKNILT